MGELERQRAARDLWISRGHLKAALAGAFVLSGVSFATGYLLGSDGGDAPRSTAPEFLAQVPGEDLVELLARVEANRAPDGAVRALTFPDALAGAEPASGPVAPGPEQVAAPAGYVAEEAKPPALPAPPAGAYTIEVARPSSRAAAQSLASDMMVADLAPWVGARIENGGLQYTVSLGSFASESAAEAALIGLAGHPDIEGASVRPIPGTD